MEFTNFITKCEKKNCPRNTVISKNCLKDYKREDCFKKYNNKIERDLSKPKKLIKVVKQKPIKRKAIKVKYEKDTKWDEVRYAVWQRDTGGEQRKVNWYTYCRLWKVLDTDEQHFVLNNFGEQIRMMPNVLDPAHAIGKGNNIDEKYNVDNVFLIFRYFHTLLDTYKDPVTQKDISKEERIDWFDRIKK